MVGGGISLFLIAVERDQTSVGNASLGQVGLGHIGKVTKQAWAARQEAVFLHGLCFGFSPDSCLGSLLCCPSMVGCDAEV